MQASRPLCAMVLRASRAVFSNWRFNLCTPRNHRQQTSMCRRTMSLSCSTTQVCTRQYLAVEPLADHGGIVASIGKDNRFNRYISQSLSGSLNRDIDFSLFLLQVKSKNALGMARQGCSMSGPSKSPSKLSQHSPKPWHFS